MKAISKLTEPIILRENFQIWTQEYIDAVRDGLELKPFERWRRREIKQVLGDEVAGKCAYCEGFVEDVSYPHVEHIRPKDKRPELAHYWSNLTSACSVCNAKKGNYDSDEFQLINPYVDEVETFVVPLGALVDWVPGSGRGEITVKRLDLNRYELVMSRVRRIGSVRESYERWRVADEPAKEAMQHAITEDAISGEFAASVMAYLRELKFPI